MESEEGKNAADPDYSSLNPPAPPHVKITFHITLPP